MLDTTARLVQRHGYHGTGLHGVLTASGAPRGSLYFHFPGGKEQLVTESTRAAAESITRHRRDVLATAKTPADAVRAFGRATAARLRETDFALGCPIAPVVLDGLEDTPGLLDLCRDTFEEWIELLRAAFVKSGIPAARATTLALLTQSSFEGAMMIARAYRDDKPVLSVADELAGLIDSALPNSPARHAGSSRARRPSPRRKPVD